VAVLKSIFSFRSQKGDILSVFDGIHAVILNAQSPRGLRQLSFAINFDMQPQLKKQNQKRFLVRQFEKC
jgi:hypothetical protein